MDDRRFDALVRSLASGHSRRAVLKGFLGLGGLAATGAVQHGAEAARRPVTPTPVPNCPGNQTLNGATCVCPGSLTKCGPACCNESVPRGDSAHSECCDNACCHGECYGEELCCPTGQVVCNGNCCAAGEVCFQGTCQRCTLCGDDCCRGDTSQCCQNGETSICIASESTCCADDSVCYALNYCDAITAHRFNCVDSVCTETVQNCQGTDPCSTYRCDTGFCFQQHITGCCTLDTQCQPADSCTPADCLENKTCNAISRCVSDEHCCSGICASTLDRCCGGDDDCSDLDFCSAETLDAYHYTCVEHVCTRQIQDCLGDDPCTQYGCNQGVCTSAPRPGCCEVDEACDPADDCTVARCLGDGTCNTVSKCTGGETCCADGACSSGGSCVRGCIIEGVLFPPCVDGCNICVAPDQGTLCGCAVTTTLPCTSSDICKDQFGDAICAGPPGSAICVKASGPLN